MLNASYEAKGYEGTRSLVLPDSLELLVRTGALTVIASSVHNPSALDGIEPSGKGKNL